MTIKNRFKNLYYESNHFTNNDLIKKRRSFVTKTGFVVVRKKFNPLENNRVCNKLIGFLPPSSCGQIHVLFRGNWFELLVCCVRL